jgi:hypothetical protein
MLVGDAILDEETEVDLTFDQLSDGDYFLVATAMCSDAAIESEIIGLTIDRTAPSAMIMKPADGGAMQIGDEISVSFNEDILPPVAGDISLVRKRGDLDVPFQYGCSLRKLVLLPDSDVLEDGDTLIVTVANVEDIYENGMETFSWSFAIPEVEEIFEDPMLDSDKDGIPDASDICVLVYNPNQDDMDGDLVGDACDDDIDGDGVLNLMDKCPFTDNPDQLDTDNDGIGDACDLDIDGDAVPDASDNCVGLANSEQGDLDMDGIGDACDEDMDGDGYTNESDNCPMTANPDQTDSDNDGIGDACETSGIVVNEIPVFLSIYPNPFDSKFILEMNIEKESLVKIELSNFMGQIVQVISYERLPAGAISSEIDAGGLPDGIYFIRLSLDGNMYTSKILKVKQ